METTVNILLDGAEGKSFYYGTLKEELKMTKIKDIWKQSLYDYVIYLDFPKVKYTIFRKRNNFQDIRNTNSYVEGIFLILNLRNWWSLRMNISCLIALRFKKPTPSYTIKKKTNKL